MVEVNLKLILTYLWVNIRIRLRISCTLICFVLFSKQKWSWVSVYSFWCLQSDNEVFYCFECEELSLVCWSGGLGNIYSSYLTNVFPTYHCLLYCINRQSCVISSQISLSVFHLSDPSCTVSSSVLITLLLSYQLQLHLTEPTKNKGLLYPGKPNMHNIYFVFVHFI